MSSIKFYLRNPKAVATTITVNVRWFKHQLNYSTRRKIKSQNWDSTKQCVKKGENVATYNNYLKNERELINDAFAIYETEFGTIPDASQFKKYLKSYRQNKKEVNLKKNARSAYQIKHGVIPTPEQFKPFYDQYRAEYYGNNQVDVRTIYNVAEDMADRINKELKSKGRLTDRNSYSTSILQTRKVLKEFEDFTGYSLNFESIDLEFYYQFVEWCNDAKRYSQNNIGKHVKNVKAIMNQAVEDGLTNNEKHLSKRFKILKEDVFNIYLNERELKLLFDLDLSNSEPLSNARDLFLIGCWTGLRISDYKRIKKHHLIDDRYIEIRTQKTEKRVKIPLNYNLRMVLDKHDFEPPKMPDSKLNKRIKVVGKLAGLDKIEKFEVIRHNKKVIISRERYEMITSHTARRSFATNRYDEGLKTTSIMAITGHTTEKAFFTYIKDTPDDHLKKTEEHYRKLGQHLKVSSK